MNRHYYDYYFLTEHVIPTGNNAKKTYRQVFDESFEKGDPESCWEWQGHLTTNRYGDMRVRNKSYLAHRVSYLYANGDIPDGLVVCHKCDNPPCVNPNHLFIGTMLDNARDRMNKGRSKNVCGEEVWQTKLNPYKVQCIRLLQKEHRFKHKEIADIYGLSQKQVTVIVNRQQWKHVE